MFNNRLIIISDKGKSFRLPLVVIMLVVGVIVWLCVVSYSIVSKSNEVLKYNQQLVAQLEEKDKLIAEYKKANSNFEVYIEKIETEMSDVKKSFEEYKKEVENSVK